MALVRLDLLLLGKAATEYAQGGHDHESSTANELPAILISP